MLQFIINNNGTKMTYENTILLTQNTSNILPNVKGKEEEIKS